ncbi:MAG: hypothetical protein AAF721_12275 [Myxococcota bacterium]
MLDRLAAAAGVCTALFALGCPPSGPLDQPEPAKSLEHAEVAEVAELVGEFEVVVDTARLEVEVGDDPIARADIAAALNIAVRGTHFDVMWHMRRILEARPRYGQVRGLLDAIAESKLPLQPVYYTPERKAIVFRQQWQANLIGVRPWTAHHLVYASHDQAPGGLITMLADQGQLLDSIRIRQCLLEGQARLVEVAAGLSVDGHTLHDVDVEAVVQPPASFIGGEIETPCPAGIRLLMLRYQEHGWENVAVAVRKPPDSTEQLLHPEKIGVDYPAHVGLPRWPTDAGLATLVHDDVIGELTIHRLLRERGVPEPEAQLASVGWDGDRLNVFAIESGARVTIWRSVWDRDLDARQFAAAVAPKKHEDKNTFRVVQTGRIVDCVSAESDALAKAMGDLLASVAKAGKIEQADVASTAAVEARITSGAAG